MLISNFYYPIIYAIVFHSPYSSANGGAAAAVAVAQAAAASPSHSNCPPSPLNPLPGPSGNHNYSVSTNMPSNLLTFDHTDGIDILL